MRRSIYLLLALLLAGTTGSWAACCYFAAIDKDVTQPGQRAFITWDAKQKLESFTVQPIFEGNAADFGMVIPTPSQPKLQEMPRDFFRALAVFTILEPMDVEKFKQTQWRYRAEGAVPQAAMTKTEVRVLEKGVVGSLDYKILEADRAEALYEWLKQNDYSYAGDAETLDHYVQKKWNFTVMKIDPRQMKKRADGTYEGEVTPTRFTFRTNQAIYPLRITQISVKDQTDALLYLLAEDKMDLPGNWSYQPNFLTMWQQAMGFAVPEKLTTREKQYLQLVDKLNIRPYAPGANLEWAGKLTRERLAVLSDPDKYNRHAPKDEIARLKLLRGHLKEGQFLTKFRKVFKRDEMTQDLVFVPATIGSTTDELEYVSILPTSPP